MAYLALDFGGSAVKGAIMTADATIIEKFTLPSRVASLDAWFMLADPVFNRYKQQYPITGIAVSVCGAVDVEEGRIYGQSSLAYLHGVNIKHLLEQRYQVTVEIENDACCAALAESWLGSHCESSNICLVVIGSGIGGGLIVDGKLYKGHQLYSGEFGCAILGFDNGQPRVASELASTWGLVKQVAYALNIPRHSLNGKKVFELYKNGDPIVIEAVEAWSGYLATLVFNLQYTLDPEVIVLGGAISQQPLLIPILNKVFERYMKAMPFCHIMPNVVASRFGNDANLVGAVAHFIERQHEHA